MKIQIPKSKAGQFLFFACTQSLSYFLVVANTRAYTHADYLWTAVTDVLFTAQSFIVTRLFVKDENATGLWAGLGYTFGGTAGTLMSIFVMQRIYGH